MRRTSHHIVWVAAVAALVALPARADTAADFKSKCAACHMSAEKLALKIKGATLVEKKEAAEKALAKHKAVDAASAPAFVEYLLSLLPKD